MLGRVDNTMILCDTNILIEFYKNNPTTIGQLRAIGQNRISISIITQAELYFGALNKVELKSIKSHLNLLHIVPMDMVISEKFIELMNTYSLSHRLGIPDALIAATALSRDLELYTMNLRDFQFIDGLKMYNPTE